MHPFQRRLLGNRVYWRDCDVDAIAKHMELTARDVADLGLFHERDALPILDQLDRAASDDVEGEAFRFVLSSHAVDSYGDTIDQMGWDYSRADKNLPVLAHHDGKSAIGQWSLRQIHNGMLKATWSQFSSGGYSKFIASQVREGVLRAASVGFLPGQWKWSEDPKRKYGIDFIAGHQLLEASVVAIGACPDCLLEQHIPGTPKQNGLSETTPAPSGAKSFPYELARASAFALKART